MIITSLVPAIIKISPLKTVLLLGGLSILLYRTLTLVNLTKISWKIGTLEQPNNLINIKTPSQSIIVIEDFIDLRCGLTPQVTILGGDWDLLF